MPLLASESKALELMEKAEEVAKLPYHRLIAKNGSLTSDEVTQMTKDIRLAGLQALFAHIVLNTELAGAAAGSVVTGKIL